MMDRLRFNDENGIPFNNVSTKKISQLGVIQAGGTPSTDKHEFWNGDIDWIQSGLVQNNIIKKSDINKKITRLGLEQSAAKLIDANSILIAITGATCANVSLLPFEATANQSVISITPLKDNPYYIYQYLLYKRNVILRLQGGSAQGGVTLSDLKNIAINVPVYEEQEKIGGFLSSFDKLIQKQQEKIGLLKELKKGYLQQMFPVKGSNIPKIRFKGFTEAWEQCKFKDVFVKLQNNSLSRADLNDEFGYAMNVHYGDVLIKFNEILDFKTESVPYITEPTIIEKYKNSFLQNGDIIIADAAEDNTVGKCCEIAGLSQETVLSGLHTIPCRPSKDFASGFLGYYMNSGVYHDQLLPLIQGSKISSISINTLSNTSLVYPKSIEEQSLIANKFRALDKLITLHQRKLEGLVKIKKGYIQRLFA